VALSNKPEEGAYELTLSLRALRGSKNIASHSEEIALSSRILTKQLSPKPSVRIENQARRPQGAAGTVMAQSKMPPEVVSRLRTLAHDLSNSLETIMQASYLLGQLEMEAPGKKWVQLIEEAAQDAAGINRELREVLRG
jgi:hypothetical protein